MTIEHLPASASPETVTEIIRRDGAVIVDSVLTHDAMDDIAAHCARLRDVPPEER